MAAGARQKRSGKLPLLSACRGSGLRHVFEVSMAPLGLRHGQGAMQGNSWSARLFADLPYNPQGAFSCPFGTIHLASPKTIKASGGQSRAPPVAGGARRKPSEQGSARKAPRADAARPLRTALRPPAPRRGFGSLSFARYDVPFPGRSLQCPCCAGLKRPWRALVPLLLPWRVGRCKANRPQGHGRPLWDAGMSAKSPLKRGPWPPFLCPGKGASFSLAHPDEPRGHSAPRIGPRGRPGQLPKKKGSTSWSMRGFQ